MKIYQIYIFKKILSSFFILLFLIVGFTWLTQIYKLIYLFDKNIQLLYFLKISLYAIPSILFISMPLVSTVAVTYAYYKMCIKHELLNLSSAGISVYQALSPIYMFMIPLLMFNYCLSFKLVPESYQRLKNSTYEMRNQYVINIVQDRTFTKITKYLTLYVKQKFLDGHFGGLVIIDNSASRNPTFYVAKEGNLRIQDNIPIFTLNNGSRQFIRKNGDIDFVAFEKCSIVFEYNEEYPTRSKELQEYYISDLLKSNLDKLKTEGHHRIIWPLYSIILSLISPAIIYKKYFLNKLNIAEIIFQPNAFVLLHFLFYSITAKGIWNPIYLYVNLLVAIAVCFLKQKD